MARYIWWSYFLSFLFIHIFIQIAGQGAPKPYLALALAAALFLCLGTFLSTQTTKGNRNTPAALFRKGWLLAGLPLGFFWAIFNWQTYFNPVSLPADKFSARILRTSPHSLVAETKSEPNRGASISIRFRLFFTKANFLPHSLLQSLPPEYVRGAQVSLLCQKQVKPKVIDSFSFLEYLQGIRYRCFSKNVAVARQKAPDSLPGVIYVQMQKTAAKWRASIAGSLYRLGSTFAGGFLLADTSAIPEGQLKLIRKMGISHLFSASGLHLGLLFGAIVLPFRLLSLPLTGTFCAFMACFFYVLLLDFRLSILRAFLFLFIYLANRAVGRQTSGVDTLFLTALVIEKISPLSSFSPSFLLSFGITLIIFLTFPVLRKSMGISIFFRGSLEKSKPGQSFLRKSALQAQGYLRDHLALTISATAGSSFLSFLLFGYFHVLSILYNLVLVPFSGVYLVFALLSVFFKEAVFLVRAGDTLFSHAIALHYLLWERLHPSIHEPGVALWLAVFCAGLALFYRKSSQGRLWTIRKFFFPCFWSLIVLFFFFQTPQRYPPQGFYVFPDGVAGFSGKVRYFLGQTAPFLKEPPLIRFPETPVAQIKADATAASMSNVLAPGISSQFLKKMETIAIETIHSQKRGGLLVYERSCFLFYTRFDASQWNKTELNQCGVIYLVHPKKRRPNDSHMLYLFRQFGFHGKLYLIDYYRWYAPDQEHNISPLLF